MFANCAPGVSLNHHYDEVGGSEFHIPFGQHDDWAQALPHQNQVFDETVLS